jgi:hypothetical protein
MLTNLEIHDSLRGNHFEWNGAHTVNVFGPDGKVFDVFSFGFDLGLGPTFVDFCCAVVDWIGDGDE